MKKKITRIYDKTKVQSRKKYLLLIVLILLLLLALYLATFSKAEIILPINYSNYETAEIYSDVIKVNTDDKGDYIILPEKINEKNVSSYYIEEQNEEKQVKEYKPNEVYYIENIENNKENNNITISVQYEKTDKLEAKEEEKKETEKITEKEMPVMLLGAQPSSTREIIYVGNIGQEGEEGTEQNPYKTLEKGVAELPNTGGEIVIEGKFEISGWLTAAQLGSKEIILSGYDENSMLYIKGNLNFYTNTTIKDITLRIESDIYFYANGKNLILGEKDDKESILIYSENNKSPYIYGGSSTQNITGDTNVIINSGRYNTVYGGSNGRTITGNTNLTINNGTYQYVYGGSNKAQITGSTKLIVNDGEINKAIYGGSYGNTITVDSTITLNGGKYGIEAQDNKTVVAIAGGSNNSGTIRGKAVLTAENIHLYNGCIAGAGNSSSVLNNINMTLNDVYLKNDGTGTNCIYGSGYTAGSSGTTNVNMTIEGLRGNPEYILGYAYSSTGGSMPSTGIITMNISGNIYNTTTQIYGGSYSGNQTANAKLIMKIKNVTAKVLSAGGAGTNKIGSYDIEVDGSSTPCYYSDGIYLGASTALGANVTRDGNIIILNGLGNSEKPQKMYFRNKTATMNIANSYITTESNFYKADIALEKSTMEIGSLASDISSINMDSTSNLTINTTTTINVSDGISGTGTLKLMDKTSMYIYGKIEGSTKIDITEGAGDDHYIIVMGTGNYEQNLIYFNKELTNYTTDFIANSISYWKFRTSEVPAIEGKDGYIYLDSTYGDDTNNDGTLTKPIKTLKKAREIITDENIKKVVIMSDLELDTAIDTDRINSVDNTTYDSDTLESYVTVTKTDGTLDFHKSIIAYNTSIYYINQNLKFENITLKGDTNPNWGTARNVYANGNKILMGSNVSNSGGNISIYGGSIEYKVDTTNIEIQSGSWSNIYGGSNGRDVNNTNIVLKGGYYYGSIYGGSQVGDITGKTNLTISGGTLSNSYNWLTLCAGSSSGTITGGTNLTITGGSIGSTNSTNNNVYAGSANGTVNGEINTNISNGTFNGIVYCGNKSGFVNANINTNITGGTFNQAVYGANYEGMVKGTTKLTTTSGNFKSNVYCGSEIGTMKADTIFTIEGGTFTGSVCGGANKANIEANTELNIKKGTLNGKVYAGNTGLYAEKGNITGTVKMKITGGTYANNNSIYTGSGYGNTTTLDTEISGITFGNTINIYGGNENSNIGDAENKATTTLNIHDTTFSSNANIYGGGGNVTTIGNTNCTINNNTFKGTTTIYGAGGTNTLIGDSTIDIKNTTFSTTTTIYGGNNSGTITGDINFNIDTVKFNGGTTIYRGCNSGNLVGKINNTIKGLNYASTSVSTLYGGSNSGTITGDYEFKLTTDMFKYGTIDNQCNATVYGGSNSGKISGNYKFEAENIVFNSNVVATSNSGEIMDGTAETPISTNINNCTINGKLYAGKYTANNTSTIPITTNATNVVCKEVYAFYNYTKIAQPININLNNITNTTNNVKMLTAENTQDIDLSNHVSIDIKNSENTTFNINKNIKIKELKIDNAKLIAKNQVDVKDMTLNNTTANFEKEVTINNLTATSGSTINCEKAINVTNNFIGDTTAEQDKKAILYIYNGMNIGNEISGKTILNIGTITGLATNPDTSFENTGISITTEGTNKIWKVGHLNEYLCVYVDGTNGNDDNDGNTYDKAFATFRMAYLACQDNAQIIVCGPTTITRWPAATKKIVTITSKFIDENDNTNNVDYRENPYKATLTLATEDTTTTSVSFENDTTIKNINLITNKEQNIFANGNKVVFGEGINVTNGTSYLNIYGGAYNSSVDTTTLTFNSGSYHSVYLGSYGAGVTVGSDEHIANGDIVEKLTITGGTFGNNSSAYSLVAGTNGSSTSYIKGGIDIDIESATFNGYVMTSGSQSTTKGNVTVDISKDVIITNCLVTDGISSNISAGYTYTLNIDGKKGTTKIGDIVHGSLNKCNSSPKYNTTITNATITNISYGSINNSGSADTVKGSVYLTINDGCAISNIYAGRYSADSTAAGDFYIDVATNENLSTNMYRKNKNNGSTSSGISTKCEIKFENKNTTFSGVINNPTKVVVDNSTINYTNSVSAIGTFEIKNNSIVNSTGSSFGGTTVNITDSNITASGTFSGTNISVTDSEITSTGTISATTGLTTEGSTLTLATISATTLNATTTTISTTGNVTTTNNILNGSTLKTSGTTFKATTKLELSNNSEVELSAGTTTISLGAITIPSGSKMKILSTNKNITTTGNYTGGGDIYLNDGINLIFGGYVTEVTTVYCNDGTGEKYFATSALITATDNNSTPINAFLLDTGETPWNYKVNEGKRLWQLEAFEEDDIIYVDVVSGLDYGLGTSAMPVKTLDEAYKIANKRYDSTKLTSYYIVLQKDTTLTSATALSLKLNSAINVTITNKITEKSISYSSKLIIKTGTFNFIGQTTIKDLTIDTTGYTSGNVEFFGNGNDVTFGDNLTITANTNKYPIIYGGGNTNNISKESYTLSMMSGKYNMIFGGGKSSTTTSNINLKVKNIDVKQYSTDDDNYTGIFGAGRYGDVTGNVKLDIESGDFYRIYGAGLEGNTTGNITINYKGGTTDRIYGGGQLGAVKKSDGNNNGNIVLNIGGTSTTAKIYKYLRGSGQYSGMDASTNVTIYDGAYVDAEARFATGGYQGNAAKTILDIKGGTINCDVYGGRLGNLWRFNKR